MDRSIKTDQMLSYVMTRIPCLVQLNYSQSNSSGSPSTAAGGSKLTMRSNISAILSVESRMPLSVSAYKSAFSDVLRIRSMIEALGKRPDHESVDSAKSNISKIESNLSNQIQKIDRESPNAADLEREVKAKKIYQDVISLYETHESYGRMLNDAKERCRKIGQLRESKIRWLRERNEKGMVEEERMDRPIETEPVLWYLQPSYSDLKEFISKNINIEQQAPQSNSSAVDSIPSSSEAVNCIMPDDAVFEDEAKVDDPSSVCVTATEKNFANPTEESPTIAICPFEYVEILIHEERNGSGVIHSSSGNSEVKELVVTSVNGEVEDTNYSAGDPSDVHSWSFLGGMLKELCDSLVAGPPDCSIDTNSQTDSMQAYWGSISGIIHRPNDSSNGSESQSPRASDKVEDQMENGRKEDIASSSDMPSLVDSSADKFGDVNSENTQIRETITEVKQVSETYGDGLVGTLSSAIDSSAGKISSEESKIDSNNNEEAHSSSSKSGANTDFIVGEDTTSGVLALSQTEKGEIDAPLGVQELHCAQQDQLNNIIPEAHLVAAAGADTIPSPSDAVNRIRPDDAVCEDESKVDDPRVSVTSFGVATEENFTNPTEESPAVAVCPSESVENLIHEERNLDYSCGSGVIHSSGGNSEVKELVVASVNGKVEDTSIENSAGDPSDIHSRLLLVEEGNSMLKQQSDSLVVGPPDCSIDTNSQTDSMEANWGSISEKSNGKGETDRWLPTKSEEDVFYDAIADFTADPFSKTNNGTALSLKDVSDVQGTNTMVAIEAAQGNDSQKISTNGFKPPSVTTLVKSRNEGDLKSASSEIQTLTTQGEKKNENIGSNLSLDSGKTHGTSLRRWFGSNFKSKKVKSKQNVDGHLPKTANSTTGTTMKTKHLKDWDFQARPPVHREKWKMKPRVPLMCS